MTVPPDQPPGEEWASPPPPGRRRQPSALTSLGGDDLRILGALAIVLAVVLLLLGALLLGMSVKGAGHEGWKYQMKVIGLGSISIGSLGLSFGGATFVGVALLVALSLAQGAARTARADLIPVVGVVAAAAAAWMMLFTLLGVGVDLTGAADGFTRILGILLIDLATLVMMSAAGIWGLTLASNRRS